MTRVLVTGGSGFTGGYVLARLQQNDAVLVHALVRSPGAADKVRRLGAVPTFGDLDVPESVAAAFASCRPEVLINVASLGFGHAPMIVAAAEQSGVERAVFVSTTAIFTKLAAASKRVRVAAEERVAASNLDWRIIRPTMIYGAPGDRNMERLLRFLRRSPIVPIPAGVDALQQPIHVEDLAQAIVAASEVEAPSRAAFDVAGPAALPFSSILDAAMAAVRRHPRRLPISIGLLRAGLVRYERLADRPRLKVEQLDRLVEDKAFDICAAREALAFAPRPFDVGIEAEARACFGR